MSREKYYKRRISIFNFLIVLIVTSILVIFYISNIIYVNEIASENLDIKNDINKVKQTNDLLGTEIEKLSNYERIRSLASEKFGLALRQEAINENYKIILNQSDLNKE
jgi:cell division protein FtsL